MRCSLLCPWHGTDCPSRVPNYGSGWIHAGIRYGPALRPASPSSRCSLLLKASNKYPQSTLTATGDNCICFTDELENVEQWDLPREPGPVARARAACQVLGPVRWRGANLWPSRHPGRTLLPAATLRQPRAAPRLLRVTPGARQAGSSPLAWQRGRWDGHPTLPPSIPCGS